MKRQFPDNRGQERSPFAPRLDECHAAVASHDRDGHAGHASARPKVGDVTNPIRKNQEEK
jgi:hypothetical protein